VGQNKAYYRSKIQNLRSLEMITIYGKSQTKDSSEVKNIMKVLILDVASCGVEIYESPSTEMRSNLKEQNFFKSSLIISYHCSLVTTLTISVQVSTFSTQILTRGLDIVWYSSTKTGSTTFATTNQLVVLVLSICVVDVCYCSESRNA
jgi:hypothetical protein